MRKRKIKHVLLCLLAIVVALIWVFPIIYMIISSFKTETDVVVPGIIFSPTIENYRAVLSDTFFKYLGNSILITLGTVIITVLLAVPAGYGIVFTPLKNPNSVYFWFVSTTFLPAIAVIIPVYLIFQKAGLVDNPIALIILYCGAGVPLMIWLVTNFFKEIPTEVVEAASLDGCNRLQAFWKIMIPLVRNGIFSAALLVFIITWNEFFFAVTVTYTEAATLPVYMSKYMTQQGYFWGKMCATGTLICIIPIILGFFTQKSLVKGLTSGSVKG
ncbi:MAG TPA: sugar ABC transporter permease [Clostridiales bacterium]|jgi:sorbitol/mannitol transport system permease protein|uniref:carbohydrate ABC transporter permease n=1 Tax=Muricomes intestini TaxID=1796634 RepID=UPI000EC64404|nr:sugar ABC transporter permease [Clostridiales bacterium]